MIDFRQSVSQSNLRETMLFENPQYFPMSKSFRRRSKANLPRRRMRQVVRGKRLEQSGLAITTGAEDHTLCVIGRTSAYYNVNRSLLARVFARRSSPLHRIRHLSELLFPFSFG